MLQLLVTIELAAVMHMLAACILSSAFAGLQKPLLPAIMLSAHSRHLLPQYAINALALNEMSAPRWSMPLTFDGVTRPMGEWVLLNSGLFTESYWRWMPALVLVGYWVLFTAITFLVLQYAPRE